MADAEAIENSILSAELINNLTFSGLENTVELYDTVRSIFSDYPNIKINNVKGTSERFTANLIIDLMNEDDIGLFIENYSRSNNETLKVATTRFVSVLYFYYSYMHFLFCPEILTYIMSCNKPLFLLGSYNCIREIRGGKPNFFLHSFVSAFLFLEVKVKVKVKV